MSMLYETTSLTRKNTWRRNGIHKTNTRGYLLDGQNLAGTSFGEVLAGTVMALKANGKARPAGAAQNQAAQVGVNEINVDDANNIFVADVVTVYDALGNIIAASRDVTAVDKTSSPNTVTVDGAVLTTVEDGQILVDAGWVPVGILEDQPDTVRRTGGVNIEREHSITVGLEGNALTARCFGLTDLTALTLAGGVMDLPATFDSIAADGVFTSNVAGFLFQ